MIADGHSRMPPSEYIQSIKVRTAVLQNNLTISRCHPEINTYCDNGYNAFEYLDHIFQICLGSHSHRHHLLSIIRFICLPASGQDIEIVLSLSCDCIFILYSLVIVMIINIVIVDVNIFIVLILTCRIKTSLT